MLINWRKKILIITLITLSVMGLTVKAQDNKAFSYFLSGAQKTAQEMGYEADSARGTDLLLIKIAELISFVLSLVGVIFLVLIIYAGISWMTAGGNEDQAKKALGTITQAASGLIIIVLAYAITYFILQRLRYGG